MLWGAFGVTLFGLFLTPVFYSVVRWFTDRKAVKPVLPHGLDAVSVRATPGAFHAGNGKAEYRSLDLTAPGGLGRRRS
jgi:hypothetical protein